MYVVESCSRVLPSSMNSTCKRYHARCISLLICQSEGASFSQSYLKFSEKRDGLLSIDKVVDVLFLSEAYFSFCFTGQE